MIGHELTPSTLSLRDQLIRGYGVYLIASILFAFNGTVAKSILLTGMDTMRVSQLRVTAAFLVLLVFIAIFKPHRLKLSRNEIPMLVAYGILGIAMTQYFYFVALTYLPVGVALLIEFTAPVMVAVWFRFAWKEPTKKTVWLALGLSLVGLALVAQIWMGFALNAPGVIAALLAAVSLSTFYLLGDKQLRVTSPRDPVSLTMWGFGAASLFWAILAPWWSFPWELLQGQSEPLGTMNATFPLWAMTIWMVVLGTVAPFSLTVISLQYLRASQASTIGLTEPLFAIIIAWLLLDEALTVIQILGGVLILTGVVIAERSRNRTSLNLS